MNFLYCQCEQYVSDHFNHRKEMLYECVRAYVHYVHIDDTQTKYEQV
jgi:hypothetical protein